MTTQPPTTQQQTTGHPVATAVAVTAIAAGAPDPWLPLRWARLTALVRAERRILAAYHTLLATWLPRLRAGVIHGGVIDPAAVFAATADYTTHLDPIIQIHLSEVYRDAYETELGDVWEPDANAQLHTYLAGARNRLTRTPDSVYALVKREVATAANQGWPVEQLAARIDQVFADSDTSTWAGRAMTVARTESLAAYNAGTYAAMLSEATTAGGQWLKGWLATEDERTRATHRAADIHMGTPATRQIVPITAPFIVGGFPLMVPGDPVGPPQEIINCRCTPVMFRDQIPGRAGRQMRTGTVAGGR